MAPRKPCVLAVGGLDPGGGAGILADTRAISRAGAFACAVASVLTVQSTSGLRSVTTVASREVTAACSEVFRYQDVKALKIGALGDTKNVAAIADLLAIHRAIPAVVDTVMIPTRGRTRLLDERALASLRKRLLPRATLVTANAPEAEALTGRRVTRLDEAIDAARALLETGSAAVLVKGGHLGGKNAVDVLAFADGSVIEIASARRKLPPTHGGGCVLASLIAGRLALADAPRSDRAIESAVRWAKRVHHTALGDVTDVGGDMRVLLA